jgi:hypothetical protein
MGEGLDFPLILLDPMRSNTIRFEAISLPDWTRIGPKLGWIKTIEVHTAASVRAGGGRIC